MENSEKVKKRKHDPNVVGLEQSSDDESISSDEAEEVANGETGEVVKSVNEEEEVVGNDIEIIDNDNLSKNEDNKAKKKEKNAPVDVKPVINIEEKKKALLEHPTVHVDVKRDPKIQVARLKLPILGEEQRIMELINENEFLIVAGETGKKSNFFNIL